MVTSSSGTASTTFPGDLHARRHVIYDPLASTIPCGVVEERQPVGWSRMLVITALACAQSDVAGQVLSGRTGWRLTMESRLKVFMAMASQLTAEISSSLSTVAASA
jgi:hypothetical protein